MPLNLKLESLIIENAHLIREEKMPQCLIEFVTHVLVYKAFHKNGKKMIFQSANQ